MELIVILDVLAVILQLAAAWFAYRIYRFNRLSKWWLALVLAFCIQGLRRGFQGYIDLGYGQNLSPILDRSLMFVISLLIVVGLFAMLKNFEGFEVVANKVRQKAKAFK